MYISRDDYWFRNNASGPPDKVFKVWCALSPHTAAIPQWPDGSNGVFLTGRLGVSPMMHISRKDYLSGNNTSPDMVFNVWCALSPNTATVPQWPVGSYGAFLTGRLGVSPTRQTSGLNCMVKITHLGPPRLSSMFGVFRVTHSAVKCIHSSVAGWELWGVPQWPVGSILHDAYINKGLLFPK